MSARPYIAEPCSPLHGEPVAIVTDALSGISTAHYRDGAKVIVGHPICPFCDGLVEHDECVSCDVVFGDPLAGARRQIEETRARYAAVERRRREMAAEGHSA